MIKLKDKVNRSETLRIVRKNAERIYKNCWKPEIQIEAYVEGVKDVLNYLHKLNK